MLTVLKHVWLIPYGADRWSLADVKPAGLGTRGLSIETPFPCVAVDGAARRPLRFNTSSYVPGAAAIEAPGMLERLRLHTRQMCRPWDAPTHAFVDAYFTALVVEIAADADRIAAATGALAGLYAPDDWVYDAPRPLPRAFLLAPGEVVRGTEADFVQVDVGFWLGDEAVAVFTSTSGLPPHKARQREARLAAAGVRCVTYDAASATDPAAAMARVLGRPLRSYWRDVTIPCGPFRPEGLAG